MARLKGSVKFRVTGFKELEDQFPDVNGGYLAYVGKRGRQIMKNKLFAGQELDYRNLPTKDGFPVDKTGRPVIMSDVNKKRNKVTLYSYPAILYEKSRLLRSGRKETAKAIFRTKLKREIATNMQRYARQYEGRFLKKALKGMGL